jgi:hypothetical protein
VTAAKANYSYVYLPFGPYIMSHIQKLLFRYQGPADAQFSATHKPEAIRAKVNSGRLRSQVFACKRRSAV